MFYSEHKVIISEYFFHMFPSFNLSTEAVENLWSVFGNIVHKIKCSTPAKALQQKEHFRCLAATHV